jgi:uncharacterized membrane protein
LDETGVLAMSRSRLIAAVVFFALANLSAGAASAQGQTGTFTLLICNKSQYYLFLAVAHLTAPGANAAEVEGWWPVNPYACGTLGVLPGPGFYTYATGSPTANEKSVVSWSGTDANLCIEWTAFTLAVPTTAHPCAANQALVGFKLWQVPAGSKTFTVTFN